MRERVSFNKKWYFRKGISSVPTEILREWEVVNLPHTWNAIDGQDGGNDYYRGKCCYMKRFRRDELPRSDKYYLEINGANSSAEVYLNGKALFRHDGGYSRFRVDITDGIVDENILAVLVDNSKGDEVYPQMADFTFYGGLYRDVNIICTEEAGFDLEYFGGDGVMLTPLVENGIGRLLVKMRTRGAVLGDIRRIRVYDHSGDIAAECECTADECELQIKAVRVWHGKRDAYLYTVRCEYLRRGEVIDAVSDRVGFRSVGVDSSRGFILNGEEYALHGVSRHQDRFGLGNALLHEHHLEDMELIEELGTNAIRLAHYQQDGYFYDLCDERGMVVWAEIPYISKHMPRARENAITQMKELIIQNYNHPSIVFLGISNEITMSGGDDEDMIETHKVLNDLCHKMDKTRITAVAAVSHCPTDSPYLRIPDAVAYNHYFGWYGGEVSMNGEWFDEFHRKHPDIPIGCSEYGCEGLNFHSSSPSQGDYTEEYQAYYHEELIKQLFSRKYLFATFVWNMFDFGADARGEGGEPGQNHKGLVSFDRKYKKDAFYAYKAHLSKEPFVHIAGKRYVKREGDTTKITVYSNQPTVELYINNECVGREHSDDHFFYFTVKNVGESRVVARAGIHKDESKFVHVPKFCEEYRLREQSAILNWFDITEREGYFSLNDKIEDIIKSEEGRKIAEGFLTEKMGENNGEATFNEESAKTLGAFSMIRLVSMLGMMGVEPTKEELLSLNARLNEIKK